MFLDPSPERHDLGPTFFIRTTLILQVLPCNMHFGNQHLVLFFLFAGMYSNWFWEGSCQNEICVDGLVLHSQVLTAFLVSGRALARTPVSATSDSWSLRECSVGHKTIEDILTESKHGANSLNSLHTGAKEWYYYSSYFPYLTNRKGTSALYIHLQPE